MFALVVPTIEQLFGIVLCIFVAGLGGLILWMIFDGRIDLSSLLSEANGQASMSRFQLLIFIFVIAVSLFALVEKSPSYAFPEIPNGVLTLLGISASTYAVGKGISYSQPDLLLKTKKPPKNGVDTVQAQDLVDQLGEHAANLSQAAEETKQAARDVSQQAAAVQQAAVETKASVKQAAVHAADAKRAAAEAQGTAGAPAPGTTITQVTVEQAKEG
jgi:hypothetical protein